MRFIYILLLLSCISNKIISQDFAWAKSIGGNNEANAYSIVSDNNGYIYVSGYFSGTMDFDPGPTVLNKSSSGSYDIFILKMDIQGNLIWVKTFGGGLSDLNHYLNIDKSGNLLTIGTFQSTINFDPTSNNYLFSSNSNAGDIYVLKIDANGNTLWANQITGTSLSDGRCIVSDSDNNIYFAGFFSGNSDFDPGPNSYFLNSGNNESYLSKLDSNGNFQWVKLFSGPFKDRIFSIAVDDNKNIYTTGSFEGSTDFDPGAGTHILNSNGSWDIFATKMDSMGNLIWAKNFGGNDNDQGKAMDIDDKGNFYLSGHFEGIADFDPGSATLLYSANGIFDIFLLRLDPLGNLNWSNHIVGSNVDYNYDANIGPDGNFYITGNFAGNTDFDPSVASYNLISGGSFDPYIAKYDTLGNFIWAKHFSGNLYGRSKSVFITNNNSIYTTGWHSGSTDFDPGSNNYFLLANGTSANFISKLTQCTNSSSVFPATACNSYISPSGKYTWSTSGVYTDTIPNAGGCDSTMIINLNIKESTRKVIFVNTCNSYTSPSGKYTWNSSGTYKDTIQNTVGCDSVLVIGLIIHQGSSSTISATACQQYSSPSGRFVWTNSGNYQDTLQSANGCDSIININLTITSVDTSVTVNQNVLIANANNASYQWIDCNNGNSPITGGTSKSYVVSADGSYAVIVDQNNCSDTSVCIPVIVSGIDELDNNPGLSIYPNPTKGILNIDQHSIQNLKIIDIAGKVVFEKILSGNNKVEIDISHLNNGIYFLQLRGSNTVINKKIILAK